MRLKSGRMALCGVLAGLSVVVMLMTYILPSFTYALPMIAGALLLVPCIEFGTGTALTIYAAVSLLSLFVAGEKEAAMFYLLLFGVYPIIKKYFERLKPRPLEIVVKFLYFNAASFAAIWLAGLILGVGMFKDDSLGRFGPLILAVLGNAAFWVYDLCLTRLISLYVARFQTIVRSKFLPSK